ncbi:MAG: hypothetical protein Q4D05_06935 [Acinetobacter sp.]|nr:hypothetical protein [Acinetobacter sp.]
MLLKQVFCTGLVASALLVGQSAHAQSVSDQTLDKYIQVSDLEGNIRTTELEEFANASKRAYQLVSNATNRPLLTEHDLKIAQQIRSILDQHVQEMYSSKSYLQFVKDEYKKIFTEEEIAAAARLIADDAGKSFLEKFVNDIILYREESLALYTERYVEQDEKSQQKIAQIQQLLEQLKRD